MASAADKDSDTSTGPADNRADRTATTIEQRDTWEDGADERGADEQFIVDVGGFEGPLDLLLALARTQKVDIARVSIVELVDQYLAFIREVQKLRLEIAADYLVMAAWLAFLKSRLLLPRDEEVAEELTAEEAAQRLAFRLMRLDAMRRAAADLMNRKRLGKDVFARGWHEPVETFKDTRYSAEIVDLLKAYAERRRRAAKVEHVVKRRTVWSIKEARGRLERLIGARLGHWVQLDLFLVEYLPNPEAQRTVLASAFGASLEMARDGLVELRQDQAFAPLFVRRRGTTPHGRDVATADEETSKSGSLDE
ncbi:MAG: segregation/condensation protein A [Hyphomicrobiaceae bacterium]|nr:segregation/condensation protein A [Hyphomicrobiaceae bacterium]MCC0010598.1 segregation/condensation protein A [Hyphomicrobiaceae bacterium]